MSPRIFGENLYLTPIKINQPPAGPYFSGASSVVARLVQGNNNGVVSATTTDEVICQKHGLAKVPVGAPFADVESYLELTHTAAQLARCGQSQESRIKNLRASAEKISAAKKLPWHPPFFDNLLVVSARVQAQIGQLCAQADAFDAAARLLAMPGARDARTPESEELMRKLMFAFTGGRPDPSVITNVGFIKGDAETNLLMMKIMAQALPTIELDQLLKLMHFFSDLCPKDQWGGGGTEFFYNNYKHRDDVRETAKTLRQSIAKRLLEGFEKNPAFAKSASFGYIARLLIDGMIRNEKREYLGDNEFKDYPNIVVAELRKIVALE